MPTLVRLRNCTITLYAGDHMPPHFHVRMRDGREALVEIKTLAILSTTLKPAELVEALAWAAQNSAALTRKWQELNP